MGGEDGVETFGTDPGMICPLTMTNRMIPGCPPIDDEEPPPPPPPATDPCPSVAGGANFYFQHGSLSSPETWSRMEPWMKCDFKTSGTLALPTSWPQAINTQRDELIRWFGPSGQKDMVMIGHSNGGLVVRAFAQWAQANRPGMVKGVVTLDSPNQGAIIARNVNTLEAILGFVTLGTGWAVLDIAKWHPFYEDDVPGSPFLSRLNSTTETFARAGIQTHTPKRWVAWRVLSGTNCMPESNCGDRAKARKAQERYDKKKHCAKAWYKPWKAIPCAAVMVVMNAGDAAWNGFTAPSGRTSDGFIHGDGQVYPRAQRNDVIRNGDSHTATVKSPYVRQQLHRTMIDPNGLNLTRRQ